ncbi:hypothetical protein GCM10008986_27090 [Salinibacillus aidingensis]|uniref:Uncharacterized protein n=1 Tax=Salinibacillus aidingensis TaxID=237684 RepID=A0ABN1BIB3_9BACI
MDGTFIVTTNEGVERAKILEMQWLKMGKMQEIILDVQAIIKRGIINKAEADCLNNFVLITDGVCTILNKKETLKSGFLSSL